MGPARLAAQAAQNRIDPANDVECANAGSASAVCRCKTDLAARMQTLYPDLPDNDGQRQLGIDLTAPLPVQAIGHLAQMTFRYHLDRRSS